MLSALRKMGNSTGLIVPKAVLREAGVESGTTLDLIVEDGRIVAIPVRDEPRAGWAEAAQALANEPDDLADWRDLPNESDAELTW